MPQVRVTEIKEIDINRDCVDNPVYLCWLNTLGVPSYWLFNNRIKMIQTAADGEYEKIAEDLEGSIGVSEFLSKTAEPSFIIGAEVPVVKMDGMQGLIQSPKVEMLMNTETWITDGGPIWQRVKLRVGSFLILNKSETFNRVQLEIVLTEINLQSE